MLICHCNGKHRCFYACIEEAFIELDSIKYKHLSH